MAEASVDDRPPRDVSLADRRRPGRADYENAHLIALLRGRSLTIGPATAEVDGQSVDDLAPARAAVVGVSIGAAMWAVIIFWYFV
jgi:hypothetical protein